MARGNELSDAYTETLTWLKGQRLNIAETRAVSTDVGVVSKISLRQRPQNLMTFGVNFRDEADNIVERVDITGDLLVLGRHLRKSIMCWKSLMLLGVLSLPRAHTLYPLIIQAKVSDMRLVSMQCQKERDL